MLRTSKGSEDGLTVLTYHAGELYTLGDDLGRIFVNGGLAVLEVEAVEEVKQHGTDNGADVQFEAGSSKRNDSKRANNKRGD